MKILFGLLFFIFSLFADNNITVNDSNDSNGSKYTIESLLLNTDESNRTNGLNSINESNLTIDANQTIDSNLSEVECDTQILYMHYQDVPTRIIKGEIFSVVIRILSTESDFYELNYNLNNSVGLKSLNAIPFREEKGKFYYDTFHFLAQSTGARLPDFEAFITSFDGTVHRPTTLGGQKLNIVALNPKKNFSNIVANAFVLDEYKTTSYDSNHNIIVFVATAYNTDISSFHLKNVYKQGIESFTNDLIESKITYFAVIQKEIENFKFTYFDLIDNKFRSVNIPIIVNDDSVTTQTDLKPKDQSREKLKMLIAIAVALVMLIIIVATKKYIYSFALILPIAYAMYTYVPAKEVCIKPKFIYISTTS